MEDFRPISIITSLYKIVAKVLAEMLKQALPYSIVDTQAAFVEWRKILDAILVTSEGDYKARREKDFLLKLDYEKAYYDKLEWFFLDDVLAK